MKIAIMQPYFFPYLGYFQLISSVDLFVIYDCVQFSRRGWVHRNRLTSANAKITWLTLPLKKAPVCTTINRLEFREGSDLVIKDKLRQFPSVCNYIEEQKVKIGIYTRGNVNVVKYLERTINEVSEYFSINTNFIRSSSLNIPQEYTGERRIIQIAKCLNASTYLNSPGGIGLYNYDTFKDNNIKLRFLSTYKGNNISVLERICKENKNDLIDEIKNYSFQ